MSLVELLELGKIIPLMRGKIAKLGETRYVVYLPTEMNELWKEIHESKKRVNINIEISD